MQNARFAGRLCLKSLCNNVILMMTISCPFQPVKDYRKNYRAVSVILHKLNQSEAVKLFTGLPVIEMFTPPAPGVRQEIGAEASRLAAFPDTPVQVHFA